MNRPRSWQTTQKPNSNFPVPITFPVIAGSHSPSTRTRASNRPQIQTTKLTQKDPSTDTGRLVYHAGPLQQNVRGMCLSVAIAPRPKSIAGGLPESSSTPGVKMVYPKAPFYGWGPLAFSLHLPESIFSTWLTSTILLVLHNSHSFPWFRMHSFLSTH